MTHVTIGNSVTNIGQSAFMACTDLASITIPGSITAIGAFAFNGCTALTNIMIPDSVTNIGANAFIDCTNLASVTIGQGLTTIAGSMFSNCRSLTSIAIPDSVTSIAESAFASCTSLTNVTLGSRVSSIGPYAFIDCTLTHITIPGSVTNIGGYALYCPSLTAINVDTNNSYYRSLNGVLFDHNQTTLVVFPLGIDGSYAIPAGVTSIGQAAFGCCGVTSVTIPASVTNIWQFALGGGPRLTAINVDTSNSSYLSLNGVLFDHSQTTLIQFPGGLGGDYAIPAGVTRIGERAFANCCPQNCSSLTSVTIPASVTSIGDLAFQECIGLSNVYFQGNAPVANCTVFEGDTATIYYLPGTSGWSNTFACFPTVSWVSPHPQILTIAPYFGVRSNQFGFRISWATNLSVMVEASTTIANPIWVPLGTNTLVNGWSDFSDPGWTNYPARFYRIRSP